MFLLISKRPCSILIQYKEIKAYGLSVEGIMWDLNLEPHLTGRLHSAQKQMCVDYVYRAETTGNHGREGLPWIVHIDCI